MMQKTLIHLPEIKLIGLTVRTSNANEMDPATAKIGSLFGRYHSENLASRITQRKNPGITYSVYTEYASDEHGDYTYFLGEEVTAITTLPEGFSSLVIPPSEYQRLTTEPGKIPFVVIEAWQQIWKMTPSDLGGKRAYRADFEVYDKRASDPAQAVLDIYIGIK